MSQTKDIIRDMLNCIIRSDDEGAKEKFAAVAEIKARAALHGTPEPEPQKTESPADTVDELPNIDD